MFFYGLVVMVCDCLWILLYVLVCLCSGDFLYDEVEFELM